MKHTLRLLPAALLLTVGTLASSFGPGFTGYSATPIFGSGAPGGNAPPVPVPFGGISVNPQNRNSVIVGGGLASSGSVFFSLNATRDSSKHITALTGPRTVFASASKLGSSAVFGPSFNPGEVFFHSIYSGSGGVDVGMIRWNGTATTKSVNIVPESPGGLNFVPYDFAGAGQLKVLTNSGKFYSVAYKADAEGTYDLSAPVLKATLPLHPAANVESFVYVKAGSPGFPVDSMLVAEYGRSSIAAFDLDAEGNPLPATRRVFFSGPPFANPTGMFIDPETGDLLVSTGNGSASAIYRISGFILPPSMLVTGCQSLTGPGYYHLDSDINAPPDTPQCVDISSTSDVHLDCRGHAINAPGLILLVEAVDRFSIRNCNLGASSAPFRIAQGHYGLVAGNTIGTALPDLFANHQFVFADDLASVNFVNNIVNAGLESQRAAGLTLRFNKFTYQGARNGTVVASFDGADVVVDNNIINVNRRSADKFGADQGVSVSGDVRAVVSNNNITSGRFGAIALNSVRDSAINRNTMTGNEGIVGGPLTNVAISNNVVRASLPLAITVDENVRVVGNQLAPFDSFGQSSIEISPGQTTPAVFLQKNDFGKLGPGPVFRTAPFLPGVIQDGGGNICIPGPSPYPITCH